MPQSYCSLVYHIVYSTKDRVPWLKGDTVHRVHEYLGGAIRKERGAALIVNGTADHVHLLASLRQDKAVSDVVRAIKSNSSGWLRDNFVNLRRFRWQAGYAAFSVSKSDVPKVRHYIANQEAHHKKRTFKEELVALLQAHRIEYDERYLWS